MSVFLFLGLLLLRELSVKNGQTLCGMRKEACKIRKVIIKNQGYIEITTQFIEILR